MLTPFVPFREPLVGLGGAAFAREAARGHDPPLVADAVAELPVVGADDDAAAEVPQAGGEGAQGVAVLVAYVRFATVYVWVLLCMMICCVVIFVECYVGVLLSLLLF